MSCKCYFVVILRTDLDMKLFKHNKNCWEWFFKGEVVTKMRGKREMFCTTEPQRRRQEERSGMVLKRASQQVSG